MPRAGLPLEKRRLWKQRPRMDSGYEQFAASRGTGTTLSLRGTSRQLRCHNTVEVLECLYEFFVGLPRLGCEQLERRKTVDHPFVVVNAGDSPGVAQALSVASAVVAQGIAIRCDDQCGR